MCVRVCVWAVYVYVVVVDSDMGFCVSARVGCVWLRGLCMWTRGELRRARKGCELQHLTFS